MPNLSPSREAAQAAQWELGRRAVGTDDEDLRAALEAAYAVDVAPLVEALRFIADYDAATEAGFIDEWVEAAAFQRLQIHARAVLARSQEPHKETR